MSVVNLQYCVESSVPPYICRDGSELYISHHDHSKLLMPTFELHIVHIAIATTIVHTH